MFVQGNIKGEWFKAQEWQIKATKNIDIFNIVNNARMKYLVVPFKYSEMISKELTNQEDKTPRSEVFSDEVVETLEKIYAYIHILICYDSRLKTTSNLDSENMQDELRFLIVEQFIPEIFSLSGKILSVEMSDRLKEIDRLIDIFIENNSKSSLIDIDILTNVCVAKQGIIDILEMNYKDKSGGYIINLTTNKVRLYFFSNMEELKLQNLYLNLDNIYLSEKSIRDLRGMTMFPRITNIRQDVIRSLTRHVEEQVPRDVPIITDNFSSQSPISDNKTNFLNQVLPGPIDHTPYNSIFGFIN